MDMPTYTNQLTSNFYNLHCLILTSDLIIRTTTKSNKHYLMQLILLDVLNSVSGHCVTRYHYLIPNLTAFTELHVGEFALKDATKGKNK